MFSAGLSDQRILPVPASWRRIASSNPDHDRFCLFVSATVTRFEPRATGKCVSNFTGFGFVPYRARPAKPLLRDIFTSFPNM